jgi:DNA-binding NtrC family response regulator
VESKTILIAYTDDTWARSVSILFQGTGYRVEMVRVLSEMLRKVQDNNIRVILLDDEIEGVKAHEVVPLLKRINLKTQVIAVSSEESLDLVRLLRGAGIFYQAMKPVDLEEVKSAVECAFEKIKRENFRKVIAFFMSTDVPALCTN